MSDNERKIRLLEEAAALLEEAERIRRGVYDRFASDADIAAAEHLVDSVMVFSNRVLAAVDPKRETRAVHFRW